MAPRRLTLLIPLALLAAAWLPALAAAEDQDLTSAPDVAFDAVVTSSDGYALALDGTTGPITYNASWDVSFTNLTGALDAEFTLKAAGVAEPNLATAYATPDNAHPGKVNVTFPSSAIGATEASTKFDLAGAWILADPWGFEVARILVGPADGLDVALMPEVLPAGADATAVRITVTAAGSPVAGARVDLSALGGAWTYTNADGLVDWFFSMDAAGTYPLVATASSLGDEAPEWRGEADLTVTDEYLTVVATPEALAVGVTSVVNVSVADATGSPAPGHGVRLCGDALGGCTGASVTDVDGGAVVTVAPVATGPVTVRVDDLAYASLDVVDALYLTVTPDPAYAGDVVGMTLRHKGSDLPEPYGEIEIFDADGSRVFRHAMDGTLTNVTWTAGAAGTYTLIGSATGSVSAVHALTVLSPSGFAGDDPHAELEARLVSKLDALEGGVAAAAAADAERDGLLAGAASTVADALTAFRSHVDVRFDALGTALNGFRESVMTRFDALDGRLDRVHDAVANVQGNLDARPLDVRLERAGPADAHRPAQPALPGAPDAAVPEVERPERPAVRDVVPRPRDAELPDAPAADGPVYFVLVTLDGAPVAANLTVRVDGEVVDARVVDLGPGTFRVTLPARAVEDAAGPHALVVEAVHAADQGATHHGAALAAYESGIPAVPGAPGVDRSAIPERPERGDGAS